MKLEHLNAAPAQTWNWLSINDTSIELPADLAGDRSQRLSGNVSDDTVASLSNEESNNTSNDEAPAHTAQNVQLVEFIKARVDTFNTFFADSPKQNEHKLKQREHELKPHEGGSKQQNDIAKRYNTASKQGNTGQQTERFCVILDAKNPVQCTSIRVKEGCIAELAIAALGNEGDTFSTAHALSIELEKDAELSLSHLVAQSDQQIHLEAIECHIGEHAVFKPAQYFLGSKSVVYGMEAALNQTEGEFAGITRYSVDDNQTLDLTFNLYQKGIQTKSNLNVAGVLNEGARKTLRATIDLQKGCKGATGTENETVVLAGDNVINKTLPTILCAEDDVEGNHGATIGSLSEEMLFYLATRGLNEMNVADLMQEAVVVSAVTNLDDELATAALNWAQWSKGKEAAASALEAREMSHTI